jgi:hypothetical protein
MFTYLLCLTDGDPDDPASLISAIPNWAVGEVITLGAAEQRRICAIDWEIAPELVSAGFRAVFYVEPV